MAMGYVYQMVQDGCDEKLAEHKGALKLLCEVHERFKDNALDTTCLPEPDPIQCKEYKFRYNESEYEKFSVLKDEQIEWEAKFNERMAGLYPSQKKVVRELCSTIEQHDGKSSSLNFIQGRRGQANLLPRPP